MLQVEQRNQRSPPQGKSAADKSASDTSFEGTVGDLTLIKGAMENSSDLVRTLWFSFILFGTYLMISVGAVTHRDLFLENPVKLPVLQIDLPLTAFFTVSPALFLIFHTYLLLQLVLLVEKVRRYNLNLFELIRDKTARAQLRLQLPTHVFLQLLAAPRPRGRSMKTLLLKLIAWITIVIGPILLFLLIEIRFLPYHHETVTWWHRSVLMADLIVLWALWPSVVLGTGVITRPNPAAAKFHFLISGVIVVFSLGLATFPGEYLYEVLPEVRIFPLTLEAKWNDENDWTSLHRHLFEGSVDEVSGRPTSLFSNRLVLTDQSFVDPERLDKFEISRSFRGRDFRNAVLTRVDLRKADFTGAMLNGINADSAKLQQARFGCASRGDRTLIYTSWTTGGPFRDHFQGKWPNDGCTWLQGSSLDSADLQGALLDGARLQEASLKSASLQSCSLEAAWLQGTSLGSAHMEGAALNFASLEGADLAGAHLEGAGLNFAQLQGADLDGASLQGTFLYGSQFQGASLERANLQGARLGAMYGDINAEVDFRAASLRKASVWRLMWQSQELEGTFDFTALQNLDFDPGFKDTESFNTWRDRLLKTLRGSTRESFSDRVGDATLAERLASLDPGTSEDKQAVDKNFWAKLEAQRWSSEETLAFFINLMCSAYSNHFIADGMVKNGRLQGFGTDILVVSRVIESKDSCPGAAGFQGGYTGGYVYRRLIDDAVDQLIRIGL